MGQQSYVKKSINESEDIVSKADERQDVVHNNRRKTHSSKSLNVYVESEILRTIYSATIEVAKPVSLANQVSNDKSKNSKPDEPEPDIERFSIINLEYLYKNNAVNTSDPVVARLASWSAVEALSPQTYRQPEDLSSEDSGIAKLNEGLPWTRGESSRKNYKLYYEVVLGSINVDMADERLAAIFGKDEEKQRSSDSKAVIASILVDKDGRPVPEVCAVSSFAWALPLALAKKFKEMSNWPQVEQDLKNHLYNSCSRKNERGKDLPLDKAIIMQAYEWLVEQLQIPKELCSPPEFSLRKYHYSKSQDEPECSSQQYQPSKSQDAPECSILNSFFIEDLSRVIKYYNGNEIGDGLRRYLGLNRPTNTHDLLRNDAALEQSVCPKMMPAGRWPMGSARALALLQQSAVNLITNKSEPIMSVNGPPGTGKTTLLRDVISDIIVERASAMADFEDPNQAFEATGVKVPVGENAFWHIYKLDPKIKGHEILVASSNNAAVENISHELPDIDAVAREDASYFRTISDAIANSIHDNSNDGSLKREPKQSWGLIAAALGNMKNQEKFQKIFWWDEDAAMRIYLKAVKGDDVSIKKIDKKTRKVIESREPAVVINEDVPENPHIALQKWKQAKRKFINLQQEIKNDLKALEELRCLCQRMQKERKILKQTTELLLNAGRKFANIMPPEHYFNFLWPDIQADIDQKIDALIHNKQAHPAWYHKILPFKKGEAWKALIRAYRLYCQQRIKIKNLSHQIEKRRHLCGKDIIDEAFFERTHEDKQIATPWLPENIHKKREDLFLLALAVHKAFIDVSAQKILHNVSVLFLRGNFYKAQKKAFIGDLWSTLFLLVPVISTSFASVNRMLGDLLPESLGWLLIDEAGQAMPQAAVGAIMRAKKTIIVGDPIQIQPVVTLPDRLMTQVFEYFHVDPNIWAAPKASAQTLADQASIYQSAFDTDTGERLVGIPLLVHRRCENPMFSISNEVAYNNFMVSQVKQTDGGSIRGALGPSSWFPIEGEADTKWCPDEGKMVIRLLQKLHEHGVQKPDIFIISPFRIVAQKMRAMLEKEEALLNALGLDAKYFANKCVGTVHTVQGREADTVIMVLGAPNASQDGARRWAGSPENLLNVAVSRAKRNLYVVGSRNSWLGAGSFSVLSKRLPPT